MNNKSQPVFKTRLVIPADSLDAYMDTLDEISDALLMKEIEQGENQGCWELEIINEHSPDTAQLTAMIALTAQMCGHDAPQAVTEQLESQDWLERSLTSFPPVIIRNFYIYGSHISAPPPVGFLPIRVDAATAFGSGEHPTTRGCMMATDDILRKRNISRALDMGCGSGILSMAALRCGVKHVTGSDIDPESVRVAKINLKENGFSASRYSILQSPGYRSPKIAANGPYELVMANILARPLVSMCNDLQKVLEPNGVAVLSGFLQHDESWLAAAHRQVGLKLVKRYRVDGWSTLVVGK